MERPKNLTDSLKGIIDTARLLATLTGNDDQRIPAFWIRTTEEFSKAITLKTVNEYNNKDHLNNLQYPDRITPDALRFPGIRRQIREIFEAEEEDLRKDFLLKYTDENGNKRTKINNDWIKVNRDLEEDFFGKEDEKLEQSIKENVGYRITAVKYSPEERKRDKIDVELPLSNIFRAAHWIDIKRKGSSPRFPYLVFWYIYNCFYFVLGDECPKSIIDGLELMWDRRDKLLEKPKNKIEILSEDIQDRIAPFINGHQKEFSIFADQISNNRPQMTEDNVDKIVEECDKALEMFTSNKDLDFQQIIAKLMGSDEETVRKTMDNFNLSEKNIHNIVEGATNFLSNDELKASIPVTETVDFSYILK